jgi:hypothetical protein
LIEFENQAKRQALLQKAAGSGGDATGSPARPKSPGQPSTTIRRLPPLDRIGEPTAIFDRFKVHDAVNNIAKKSSIVGKRSSSTEMGFIYIKPNANVPRVVNIIREVLDVFGIKIITEGKTVSSYLEDRNIFDKSYQELIDNAEVFEPIDLELTDGELGAFTAKFPGFSWSMLIKQKKLVSPIELFEICDIGAEGLGELARTMPAENTVQIRKGLYVTRLDELPAKSKRKAPMYVVNAFYGAIRNSFIEPNTSVNYFVVEFDCSTVSWEDYLVDVLGDKVPSQASPSSIRGAIFSDWKRLGIESAPTAQYNCIHGSSSALEGLRDRMLWVKGNLVFTDLYGSRLLALRIPSALIKKILDAKTTKKGQGVVRHRCRNKNSEECTAIVLDALDKGEI